MAQNPSFNLVRDVIECGNGSASTSQQSSRSSTLDSNADLIYTNHNATERKINFNLLNKDKTYTVGASTNHGGRLRLAIPSLFAVLSLTISIIVLLLLLPMLSNETQSDIESLTRRIESLEARLNQSRTENTYIYQTDVEVNVNKLFEEVNILNTTINNFTISQAGNISGVLEDWAELVQSNAETTLFVSQLQSKVDELNTTSIRNLAAGLQELKIELGTIAEFAKNVTSENRATFDAELESVIELLELYSGESTHNLTLLKLDTRSNFENVSSQIQTFRSEIGPQLEDLHRESDHSTAQITLLASNQLNVSRQVDHLIVSVETQNLEIQEQLWTLNDSHYNFTLVMESWSLTDETRQMDAQNRFSQLNQSVQAISNEVGSLWTSLRTTTTAIVTNFTSQLDGQQIAMATLARRSRDDVTEISTLLRTNYNDTNKQLQSLQEQNQLAELQLEQITWNNSLTQDRVELIESSIQELREEADRRFTNLTNTQTRLGDRVHDLIDDVDNLATQNDTFETIHRTSTEVRALDTKINELNTTTLQSFLLQTASQSEFNRKLVQVQSNVDRVDEDIDSLNQTQAQLNQGLVAVMLRLRDIQQSISQVNDTVDTNSIYISELSSTVQTVQMETVDLNTSRYMFQVRLDSMNSTMRDQDLRMELALTNLNQSAHESTTELQRLQEKFEESAKETHGNRTLLVDQLMTLQSNIAVMKESISSLEEQDELSYVTLSQLQINQTQQANQIIDLQLTTSLSQIEIQERITLITEDVQRAQSVLNVTMSDLKAARGELDTLTLGTDEDITRLNSSYGTVQDQLDSVRSLFTDFKTEVENSISQMNTDREMIATQLTNLSDTINGLNTTMKINALQLNTDLNATQLQVSTFQQKLNHLELVTNNSLNTTAVSFNGCVTETQECSVNEAVDRYYWRACNTGQLPVEDTVSLHSNLIGY